MRLIDADKCPCILCEDKRNAHCTYEHRSCEKFCKWLNNTAYDVEMVVAELEKAESVKNFGSVNSRNLLIPLNDAVAIVRRGGVE